MTMEALNRARMHSENQDPTKQRAIKDAMALLVEAKVTDPGQKTEVPLVVEQPSLNLLDQAVNEFKDNPHTPESVNRFWQTFLETSIKSRGLDIPVPIVSCDRTQEELEALGKEGKMWVPETKLTYSQLGKIFPETKSYALREDSPIKDEYEQDAKGVDVEVSIESPNRETTENDLRELFKSQNRKGMRLSTYILASQESKLLAGQYFDEGDTWSRLLGSRDGGHVVDAGSYVDGFLVVGWSLDPRGHDSDWGRRSEGVKKA